MSHRHSEGVDHALDEARKGELFAAKPAILSSREEQFF